MYTSEISHGCIYHQSLYLILQACEVSRCKIYLIKNKQTNDNDLLKKDGSTKNINIYKVTGLAFKVSSVHIDCYN